MLFDGFVYIKWKDLCIFRIYSDEILFNLFKIFIFINIKWNYLFSDNLEYLLNIDKNMNFF